MVQYFKVQEQRFVPAMALNEAFWIHMDNPGTEEIKQLIERFNLEEDYITDLQDADENSRMEYDEGAVLIILRVPLYYRHKSSTIPFATAPLGIIAVQDKLITVSFFKTEVLTQYLEGKHKPFNITQQSFLLQIAFRTSTYYLKFLKEIIRRSNNIEIELYQSMRNKEIIRLLRLEKSLVYFSTSLQSNEIILERMQRSRWLNQDPDAEDMVEDVIIENRQAIEMTNVHSSILSNIMDAFASIISNNLNMRMKFLTSVSIILMLPTLVASIWGMNVALPLQHNKYAFLILMGISAVAAILVVLYFIHKNLF
ncbi:MAG: magnesium transporter CorA family protein [Candidatus Cloacimonetes bacterium]|jgi:magnesium transporter|nr:magnesium transporter CorA family protein [Candidatus Cloacimonadota bacterium]